VSARRQVARRTPALLLGVVSIAANLPLQGLPRYDPARADDTHGSPVLAQANQAQANQALQAGEADKALSLLAGFKGDGEDAATAHNLTCRVRLTLGQWDAAASECEQAVKLDGKDSDLHLWLGRALGEKADHAGFMSAYSLAKRTRSEFEEAVSLDAKNVAALSDLGDFYRQAPGVVGGGIDKAQGIVQQLDKLDGGRAHELRAQIAEQQKDWPTAERELKAAVSAGPHPALAWSSLASFYAHQKQFDRMEAAIHSAMTAAQHDKGAAIAFYDTAGVLIEARQDKAGQVESKPQDAQLAATLLETYLASPNKTEDGPAFKAHLRLARLKAQLGDKAAAERERAAALALAHDYKPAQNFKADGQEAN
jgi:predicted Zn-dependent protease